MAHNQILLKFSQKPAAGEFFLTKLIPYPSHGSRVPPKIFFFRPWSGVFIFLRSYVLDLQWGHRLMHSQSRPKFTSFAEILEKSIFSIFERQRVPGSFRNHQKWIPHKIPLRYRWYGFCLGLLASKTMKKLMIFGKHLWNPDETHNRLLWEVYC